MSDEPRKLDLIERYAERLGAAESNVAEFLTSPNPDNLSRVTTSGAFRTSKPVASEKIGHRGGRVEIDLDRLERLGCILPNGDKKTAIVEQFQIIKRPLIQKAIATGPGAVRNGNSIMVTSAQPGEGKSFVSLNLAMSIASERDLFVLLIDSDHYNQSLPSMLGVKVERGLVDVLLDETLNIADAILQTNIPNLAILPSGRKHARGTELLSSQRMNRLIRDVVSQDPNRIIIIDAPPVLASTETGVLASLVGQIVMVVEQNRTGWRLVERSLARLSECSDISFVLNKVEPIWDDSFGVAYR